MAQTWVKVLEGDGEDAARALADESLELADGEYGLLEVRFPFPPPDPFKGIASWVAEQAGVHLWAEPSIEGDTLVIPFQKRSPGVLMLLANLLPWVATVAVLAYVAITVYKLAEKTAEAAQTLLVLGLVAVAALVLPPILFRRAT